MLRDTLIEAAKLAGSTMRLCIDKDYAISHKEGVNNIVTEIDKRCEEIIFETIRKQFPQHFILSEEEGEIIQDSNYKWIIDPIDGTVNFAHGIPLCCVSIGIEIDGEICLGAVYNPFLEEFFLAEKGMGATLNDKNIFVSHQNKVEKSCLATGFPYVYLDKPNGPLEVFEKLIRKGVAVRRLGSAAIDLCWVAMGRFDGYYEHKLNAWDSAAGYLMVEEAGGKVTGFNGERYNPYEPEIIASNGLIHEELLGVINGNLF